MRWTVKVIGLIPARLESSRLPKKAILDILGYPMIVHVAKRAMLAECLDAIAVCTDSKQIAEICLSNDIDVVLTKASNKNGTERIAEAARHIGLGATDIIVDIQGDEPLLLPQMIQNVVQFILRSDFDIVVPFLRITEENNPNRVKIVESGGRILYMTRASAPYPFLRNATTKKHLSIIAFRRYALEQFFLADQTELELVEGVELLRALEMGLRLGTYEESGETLAVDTQADYERVVRLMGRDSLYGKY
jgi:3-deoxy-manno-octulosonate cytidylyltransferase (CMP-KDO synthetase)